MRFAILKFHLYTMLVNNHYENYEISNAQPALQLLQSQNKLHKFIFFFNNFLVFLFFPLLIIV